MSEQRKWTAEPWAMRVIADEDYRAPAAGDIAIVDEHLVTVGIVWDGLQQSKANATLIQAAPELYEALKAQEFGGGHFAEECLATGQCIGSYCALARAALKKAKQGR